MRPLPARRRGSLVLEPRLKVPLWVSIATRLASVVVALLAAALIVQLTGNDAARVFAVLWDGAFGSMFGFTETLVRTIPLLLCGLGVALAFRMLLWNIGAEGQFHMGA